MKCQLRLTAHVLLDYQKRKKESKNESNRME
jgi:hypothetical protein